MKVICYMVALLCLINKKISTTSINVGTVLFTPSDTSKNCWSDYELSLLTARRIMQDILPEPKSIDFSDPSKIICTLLEYFQSCYDIIGKNSCGTTQHIMYLAYSDALGGYLRACLLPIIRRAFYAGQITYTDARKVYQLFDDVKSYLKTTGVGWAKPQGSFGIKFTVKPLKISKTGSELACSKLYLIEKSTPNSGFPSSSCLKGYENLKKNFRDQIQKLHGQSKNSEKLKETNKESRLVPHSIAASRFKAKFTETKGKIPHEITGLDKINLKPLKEIKISESKMPKAKESGNKISPLQTRRKRDDDGNNSNGNNCGGESKECPTTEKPSAECPSTGKGPTKKVIVPLPMLDDCKKPHAIALPFKSHPLRNILSRSSAFIVQRFYVTVIKCLCSKGVNRKDILNFNAQFYSWMTSEVFPRLGDEEWYPAFGGILRIVETIKISGYDNSGKKEACVKDPGYLYEKGAEFEESEAARVEGDFEGDCEEGSMNKRYYVMGLITIPLIWLGAIVYCCLFCLACRRKKNNENCDCSGPSDGPFKILFIVRFFRKMLKKGEKCPERKDDRREEKTEQETPNEQKSKIDKDDKGKSKEIENSKNKNNQDKAASPTRSLDRNENEARGPLPRSRSQSSSSLKSDQKAKFDGRGDHNNDSTKQQYNVTLSPIWPYKSQPDEKGESIPKSNVQNQIQMLWKKPSSQIGKDGSMTEAGLTSDANESEAIPKCIKKVSTAIEVEESTGSSSEAEGQKVYYVEKSPNAFDYNRACPYSLKNISGTSSNTQVKSEFSSTAVDLFDHIVACHNTFTNASANTYTQDSESESESDRGPTSSTESANSTTTERKPNSRKK